MTLRSGVAADTVRAFCTTYFEDRNLERTLAFLAEDALWVGTGRQEISKDRAEIGKAIRRELAECQRPYRITFRDLSESRPAPDLAVVLCRLHVENGAPGQRSTSAEVRMTFSCVADGDRCRITSVHTSVPSAGQEGGSYSVIPINRAEMERVDRRVSLRSSDILARNIPGGIISGYLEEGFPLAYVNEQMLRYLGYSYDEFVAATGGLVVNSVCQEDRARVRAEVDAALAEGREYETRYRMRKKDGDLIWVNDVGKRAVAEDGREISLSVIRDVTAEVEAGRRLEAMAAEQREQAQQYNQLFQSVLCGIVQYRLDPALGVVFENANQEAVRIFGYTPEDFWAKRNWDLPALIHSEDRERILNEIARLERLGDKQDYEYRLQRRDGTYCWIVGCAELIRSKSGSVVIQSVFLDIDGRKRAELRSRRLAEQVETSYEILSMALEHTGACEFFYYPQSRVCVIPERACAHYGCRARYENMPYSFANENVDPEHWARFLGMYDSVRQGEKTAAATFRLVGEREMWCRVTLSTVSVGEAGEPRTVIGIIEDISRAVQMEAALEQARARDKLTGLYTREHGVRLARAYLESRPPEECCALMLLDMDDFAPLQQEEGEAFGDAVLQEVADVLTGALGPEDVAVRLGGDEFMLLVKGCDKDRAGVLGPEIAARVRGLFERKETGVRISVSIGMCVTAVAPGYDELYRCAESTLRYVKEHGKGQAACYLDTSNELGAFLTQLYTGEYHVNEIGGRAGCGPEELLSFALDLLGKARNLDNAVALLLARVGKQLGLDRVSVLELNQAYLSYRYTYQWARSQTDLETGQDYYVTQEEMAAFRGSYDGEGLCDRVPDGWPGRFPSRLRAAVWDCGTCVGSMDFERSDEGYRWTAEERKLLRELTKIVSSYIMKARSDATSRAKTEFLSRMSHEIRTPMNAISGMTTIAKTVLDNREKALDCLNKIESANGYLLELINDILDMSRIESGKMNLNVSSLDLSRMLGSLDSLLRPQAIEKGVALRFDNRYTGGPVRTDGLRLNQVLVNIIGNALKFTGTGGSVTVGLEPLEEREDGVKLRFSVADTGVGIAPGALKRIFYAFEQAEDGTSSRYGGTGLGLAISSSLVQMMGGVLEVNSELGRGSEFHFTLALERGEPEEAQPAPIPRPAADFAGRRVLLAEDNELNREIAQSILEMHGFAVDCAGNGREAVERFAARRAGYYDAVLMDIRMPVMDGLEATRRIRTLGRPDSRAIPIIAMTANAFDEDGRKSLESGMDGHLSKPFQVERLLEVLADCMDKRGG